MRITKNLVIDTLINAAGLLAVGAYLSHKHKKEIDRINRQKEREVTAAFWNGHLVGWKAAGKSYFSVKENYVKMFGNVKPYRVQN